MEKDTLYALIANSTALEGGTLNFAQTKRLLEDGVSSEGKTIAEQLLALDLAAAYEKIQKMAEGHDFLSAFKLRTIAAIALKNSGADGSISVSDESGILKMCSEVNEARLHRNTTAKEELYKASYLAHFRISAVKPWPVHNDMMARLIMHEVQLDFGLEPTFVVDDEDYRKTLEAAVREDIADIFVSHAGAAMSTAAPAIVTPKRPAVAPDRPSVILRSPKGDEEPKRQKPKPAPAPKPTPKPRPAAAPKAQQPMRNIISSESDGKPKTRDIILSILAEHPYYTTADLAARIGISAKGVEKHLARLKADGSLKRIGPDKGGRWSVTTRR